MGIYDITHDHFAIFQAKQTSELYQNGDKALIGSALHDATVMKVSGFKISTTGYLGPIRRWRLNTSRGRYHAGCGIFKACRLAPLEKVEDMFTANGHVFFQEIFEKIYGVAFVTMVVGF